MKPNIPLATLVVAAACTAAMAAQPMEIGSRLELLVDDCLIDRLSGVRQVLHHPVPREVAIEHDAPWEGCASAYHSVFRDGDRYRMYYRGEDWDEGKGASDHAVICYAESRDGVHWEKPNLGIVEFRGSKENNILWARGGPVAFPADIWKSWDTGALNFSVFKDTNPACKPDEQYKATGGDPFCGLYGFKSADGIHWSAIQAEPIIPPGDFKSQFDAQGTAFWDPARGRYLCYNKAARQGPDGRFYRSHLVAASDDFRHWSKPQWVKYPGPWEHLYTNQISPYYRAPHILLGFPKRFVPSRKALSEVGTPGVSDIVLMTSRDAERFNRWGEAFIRPGPQSERWSHRNNMTAWGLVTTPSSLPGAPEELSLYSVEGYGVGQSCRLRRYTLRIDGFVSVQGPMSGGELVTKPLIFDGNRLVLNFSTSAAGSVQVEIQNPQEKPIPGFTLADCPEIFGDSIDRVVSWKGGHDVGRLAGTPVRLRFVLKDADLYSIQFQKGATDQ